MIYSPNETDSFHNQMVTNSSFQENIEQLILSEKYYNKSSIHLTLLKQSARLFDDESVIWGELRVNRTDTKEEETYLYIVTDFTIKFPDPV